MSSNYPQIKRINLCCNVIGDEGLSFLLETIKEQNSLLGLDVQYNGITDASLADIRDVLKYNHRLLVLDLRNNLIGIFCS